jgi:hypothetical protein
MMAAVAWCRLIHFEILHLAAGASDYNEPWQP